MELEEVRRMEGRSRGGTTSVAARLEGNMYI